jgi:hypothetical protein
MVDSTLGLAFAFTGSLVAALMGAALLLQTAHWSTDIVGGALLGTGVLTFTIAAGERRWNHDHLGNDHGFASSVEPHSTSPLNPVSQRRT